MPLSHFLGMTFGEKIGTTTIDKCLLFLIQKLYSITTLRTRCNLQGSFSDTIGVQKEVWQDVFFAPSLFNLHLSSGVDFFHKTGFHAPKPGIKIPILIYIDDKLS